jgi:hypothetical protein
MYISIWVLVLLLVAAFAVGGFCFRNNLKSVNKLLSKGEAVVNAAGQVVKVIKSN